MAAKKDCATERTRIYSTPIGPLKLVANSKGICAVKWLLSKQQRSSTDDDGSSYEQSKTGKDTEKTSSSPDSIPLAVASAVSPEERKALGHLRVCINWLDAYFDGTLLKFNPPRPPLVLPTEGTFFHTVWSTLASTGVGEKLSYGELAKLSGNPKAARAVGQAVKKHCLPILVPCHRVVKSGGEVGNYSGGEGSSTKQWLLKHEKDMILAST